MKFTFASLEYLTHNYTTACEKKKVPVHQIRWPVQALRAHVIKLGLVKLSQ